MNEIFDTVFIQQSILLIIGSIATGVTSTILYWIHRYFKARRDCFQALKEGQERLEQRSLRQSHTLILMAQINDDVTNRLHTEENLNSVDMVSTSLKDSKGDL